MVKVLGAKVEDSVYEEFVKKAKEEGVNQSELLRKLIISYISHINIIHQA